MGIFQKNNDGRPEGTASTKEGLVVHYTCNSPKNKILRQFRIRPLGKKFGVSPREVLGIPKKLFDEHGKPVGTIEAEQILREISRS